MPHRRTSRRTCARRVRNASGREWAAKGAPCRRCYHHLAWSRGVLLSTRTRGLSFRRSTRLGGQSSRTRPCAANSSPAFRRPPLLASPRRTPPRRRQPHHAPFATWPRLPPRHCTRQCELGHVVVPVVLANVVPARPQTVDLGSLPATRRACRAWNRLHKAMVRIGRPPISDRPSLGTNHLRPLPGLETRMRRNGYPPRAPPLVGITLFAICQAQIELAPVRVRLISNDVINLMVPPRISP
jgi:hypothetical protein